MPRLVAHAVLASLVAFAAPARQSAPTTTSDASRPAAAGRIVRLFNFEEQTTNPTPIPRFWTRNQDQDARPRPGFPRYNTIELDDLQDEPLATHGSVRLSTRGGSTSLLLDAGVIPVFKDADYLLGARIRTDNLSAARALLAARFLDEKLKPIPASERYSNPVVSSGRWTQVAIEIPGEYPNAAFIQLELLLLQPEQLAALGVIAPDGHAESLLNDSEHKRPPRQDSGIELRRQDLSGAAWFDDVSIVQLPRLELSTQAPTNIIAAPAKPEINLLVRDLTGEALSGKLILLDASGRTVDTRTISVGEGRSRSNWIPALPGFGWYRAVLDMSNSAARVGATYLDFAWLPPGRASTADRAFGSLNDEARFWLITQDAPAPLFPHLAQSCRDLRCGGLTVPIWSKDLVLATVPGRAAALRPLMDSFRSERLDLSFSLPLVPEIATDPKAVAPPDSWTLLTNQPAVAKPLLEEFLDDYGQSVQRWQVGSFSSRPVTSRAAFDAGLASIESMFGKLVPGPIIVVPATLEDTLSPDLGGRASSCLEPALYVPSDSLPSAAALAIDAFRNSSEEAHAAGRRLLVALGAAPDNDMDAIDGANSLAKRAVRAWAASTRRESSPSSKPKDSIRLALVDPWVSKGERHPQLMPRPELAAWRALVDRLADREFLCEIPLGPAGEGYLFANRKGTDTQRGGLLVLWNDSASPEQVRLKSYLGHGPVSACDVFGNVSPLADPARSPLPLSSSPIFIEGVDAELLHFISRISIDPPLLSMTSPETQHNVTITNTWSVPINGRLVLTEPGGLGRSVRRDRTWRINPRIFPISLAPGETASLPMTVAFGAAEEVGTKPFVFSVELAAGHTYDPFIVSTSMELGLRDLSFSITATPRGDDVVLEATINNQSRAPLTLVMTAFPPEMPRQLIDIGELLPGNQAIHRFTLRNVYPKHRGQRIPVAISDPEAGIRINRSVVIP